MKWLLLLLLVGTIQDVTWRDPQTLRVGWSTPGVVTCLYLDGKPVDVPCAEFSTVLIGLGGKADVMIAPGMALELRSGNTAILSDVVPPNPYPQPLIVEKQDDTYLITWQTPSNNDGCVVVGERLLAPCAPSGNVTTTLNPGDRVSLQINGVELARVMLPGLQYTVALPLVLR